ncbi:hypothetical protein RRG08_015452 [Elysia crispata]|uniref:Uncharacterized protein n=1 Tax=Elysia crispata TaxID=231223 RepID=A0AAE0YIZ7_9GAST|nr:hypothetical protein RRG08_015452 [Elysia crispata]
MKDHRLGGYLAGRGGWNKGHLVSQWGVALTLAISDYRLDSEVQSTLAPPLSVDSGWCWSCAGNDLQEIPSHHLVDAQQLISGVLSMLVSTGLDFSNFVTLSARFPGPCALDISSDVTYLTCYRTFLLFLFSSLSYSAWAVAPATSLPPTRVESKGKNTPYFLMVLFADLIV